MDKQKTYSPIVFSLIERHKQFKHKHFEVNQTFRPLVEHGQKPKVLVITCCDSRVDPALMLGCEPGELFVVRNVANLVPPLEQSAHQPSVAAALEFAVLGLRITDIIVLGHTHCGGIRALMDSASGDNDFISPWMTIAEPAKAHVLAHHGDCSLEEQINHCEMQSLVVSLQHLMTFPWIQEGVEANRLHLHGWLFDLATGVIDAYDEDKKAFFPL